MVSDLRMYAGCSADDPQLSALVGELSVKSEEFRRLWAAHTVADKGHGAKRLHHPLVGEMTLSFETLSAARTTRRSPWSPTTRSPARRRRSRCGCWPAGAWTRWPTR